jgi:poly-gamma-glutamate synthesis protein (capsule biosynthesis protein)
LTEVLKAAGLTPDKTVLSLANNHVLDQGIAGFDETVATLRGLGIRTIGTIAHEPVKRVAIGPLTLGFAASTQWRNARHEAFAGRVAMANDPGDWPKGARDGVHLLCAVPHWDWEFRHFPQADTRDLAHRLARQGFGLIVGHHAHVVQPVECIGKSTVAYGLGDFLGTALPHQPWPGRIGAIFVVDISADAATRGQVAAYRTLFFYRLRDGARERLVPVEALGGDARRRVEARLSAIYGESGG